MVESAFRIALEHDCGAVIYVDDADLVFTSEGKGKKGKKGKKEKKKASSSASEGSSGVCSTRVIEVVFLLISLNFIYPFLLLL